MVKIARNRKRREGEKPKEKQGENDEAATD